MALEVRFSAEAADQLAEAKSRADRRPEGAHATAYRAFLHVIGEVIANPDLTMLPQSLLSDDLAGVRRLKVRGRLRIFYLASLKLNRAIVLLIGYRKEGDKRDAYAVFGRLLRRGAFDRHFAELGIKKAG